MHPQKTLCGIADNTVLWQQYKVSYSTCYAVQFRHRLHCINFCCVHCCHAVMSVWWRSSFILRHILESLMVFGICGWEGLVLCDWDVLVGGIGGSWLREEDGLEADWVREVDASLELEVDEREGRSFGRGCIGLGIPEGVTTKLFEFSHWLFSWMQLLHKMFWIGYWFVCNIDFDIICQNFCTASNLKDLLHNIHRKCTISSIHAIDLTNKL